MPGVPIDEARDVAAPDEMPVLELDQALDRLEQVDAGLARIGQEQELFYLGPTGDLMRVGVAPGPTFATTAPMPLFEARRYRVLANQVGLTYDIAPDGQRFLMIKPVDDADRVPLSLVVVQNWRQELMRLVPTR